MIIQLFVCTGYRRRVGYSDEFDGVNFNLDFVEFLVNHQGNL